MSGFEPSNARSKVQTPGVFLIVVGVLYVLMGVGVMLYGFWWSTITNNPEFQRGVKEGMEKAKRDKPQMTKEEREMAESIVGSFAMGGPVCGGFGGLGILLGITVIVGAMSMLNFKSFGLAMTSAIGAALPCSCCWPFGLPIGIWAFIVLNDPDVKAAFTNAQFDRY